MLRHPCINPSELVILNIFWIIADISFSFKSVSDFTSVSSLCPRTDQAHAESAQENQGHCNATLIASQQAPAIVAQEVFRQQIYQAGIRQKTG